MEKGVYAGYPMVDMTVTVYDGSYHDVDSSEIAFKIAGSMALQDAVKKAGPITAHCPLAELTGYVTTVRSLTQGRAVPYIEPSHYAEVPKNLQEKLRVDKAT